MNNNMYFRLTPLYKEFMLLDLIEKDPNITQRELSRIMGSSVSMINEYIDGYERSGYLKRNYISNKSVEYNITKKGKERKVYLNIGYLKASNEIYLSAKQNLLSFLKQIIASGFKKIFLYGAGEVAELLLKVLAEEKDLPLEVLGIIDDNKDKQGKLILSYPIVSLNKLEDVKHDGVLISSYTHGNSIYNKLIDNNYNKDKIFSFFNVWEEYNDL